MRVKRLSTNYYFFDIITAFFVTVLLISNIASSKIAAIGPLTLDAGTILFPLSYIIGDSLTEVYGYSKTRRVIWIGFMCNVLMIPIFLIVGALPPSPDWPHQDAYNLILGLTPRIILASMIAYLAGEFSNSFILAKIKIWTRGKYLWMRTIGSTLIGEFLDTFLFILIAFTGVFPTHVLVALLLSNYIFKVLVEILFTPITYLIVNKLKKMENVDYYDKETNFNPFTLENKNK